MRKAWWRLMAWLRREEYVRTAVAEASKRAYVEGHATGFTNGQQAGYQVGLAHGELIGRQKLADELQVAYGMDGGGEKPIERDELANLKVRQLH